MSLVNLSGVDASSSKDSKYSLIPDGTYTFLCNEAVLKSTRAGTGKFIEVTLTCCTKPYDKKKVWARFNIENKSAKAEEIGKRELKKFLQCAGLDGESLESVDELLGLEVSAVISSEHTPPYDAQNVVSKWLPGTAVKKPAPKTKNEDVGF